MLPGIACAALLRKAASSGGGNDSYTVTLLNFASSLADSSASAHAFTAFGSAARDTADKPSGFTAGLSLPGSGSYISTPDSADYAFGTGDWTIEAYVKRGTSGAIENIWGQGDSGLTGGYHYGRFNASNQLMLSINQDGYTAYGPGTVTDTTTWHHIAFQRYGNNIAAAVDGAWGTQVAFSTTFTDSNGSFALGQLGAYAVGQLPIRRATGMRMSKGIARWPGFASFTPPSGPYS